MRIVAIDFETANEERRSACAVGLAWIEEGTVTRRARRLIRPPEMRFNPHNVRVHGIHASEVEFAPDFPEVYSEFEQEISGALVLAHNASFDIGVLSAAISEYGLRIPSCRVMCTMKLAGHTWPTLDRVSLDSVARYLGLSLRHHDPEDDAVACANVAMAAASQLGVQHVQDLAERVPQAMYPMPTSSIALLQAKVGNAPNSKAVQQFSSRPSGESVRSFQIEGSKGNLYTVTAWLESNDLLMSCTCPAGHNGLWCKHRQELTDGEVGKLRSPNILDVSKLGEWVNTRHPKPARGSKLRKLNA